MKRIIVLTLGLVLIAAACNKTTDDNNNNITPTSTPPPVTTPPVTNPPVTPPTTPPSTSSDVTVAYTASGFSPNNFTIKKGTKVTFVNNSSSSMWPASAPHPSHTDYPGFDPKKAIAVGSSWSFTFDKVGTWGYHDHLNPTKFGKIVVTE
ncbi:MAG: cupredoxin domain-containing protein [Candidatus Doudnabacteria bacterium]|nr:cupredoxin domain-containing protein [Candidatus Doudnabacteria bacterium]